MAAALAAGLALGTLITLWIRPAPVDRGAVPNTVLQNFWSGFTGSGAKTIAVYSNARFVGSGETGLRYFNPKIDRLEDIRELHTGVGEVIGVNELSRMFQSLGTPLEVKRAALVDWDEVKKSNVIFIGGPAENMPVRELRSGAQFDFEPYDDPDGGSRRMVVVSRAISDTQPQRFDAGSDRPARRDYAVIRLLPGLVPDRRILILAGISTLGTQAAAEFVSRADTVQTLLSKMADEDSAGALGFECVLAVNINGGVPVDSKVVAFHVIADGSTELSSAE